jgi:hypothetical protein
MAEYSRVSDLSGDACAWALGLICASFSSRKLLSMSSLIKCG